MNYKSSKPCVCCKLNTDNMICFHHLLTRKTYPEHENKDWNKISVCQKHHNEFHNKGISYMAEKYVDVLSWLLFNNWYKDNFKWRHNDTDEENRH
jgi:hypothetical protein